jgi:hypothetical protein
MYENLGITGDRNLLVRMLVSQIMHMLTTAKVTGIYNCVGPIASMFKQERMICVNANPV